MLNFLYYAVSWVLLRWHALFTWMGLDANSGVTWALSIIFLVVTIRVLLFRLFVRQVHTQRKLQAQMQRLQPKMAAIKEKHKGDRRKQQEEIMKLNQEEGINPLAQVGGCLPVLLQAPIFLSLFHVLNVASNSRKLPALAREYGWTSGEADSLHNAKLFGAPISAALRSPTALITSLGGDPTTTRVVAFVLLVVMCIATYITQRQTIANNPNPVTDGQQAMIQKFMLYGVPLSLFVSGVATNFGVIGVLLYWFANNLWTMGQQLYILKTVPHPDLSGNADRLAVDAKALAPKPGVKPVNPKGRRPATTRPGTTAEEATDGTVGTPPAELADPAEPAGSSGATAGGGRGTDGKAASTSSGSGSSASGSAGAARPPRRPSGQRSSTTTRPKKKRR